MPCACNYMTKGMQCAHSRTWPEQRNTSPNATSVSVILSAPDVMTTVLVSRAGSPPLLPLITACHLPSPPLTALPAANSTPLVSVALTLTDTPGVAHPHRFAPSSPLCSIMCDAKNDGTRRAPDDACAAAATISTSAAIFACVLSLSCEPLVVCQAVSCFFLVCQCTASMPSMHPQWIRSWCKSSPVCCLAVLWDKF
jgi:hypothetical protein